MGEQILLGIIYVETGLERTLAEIGVLNDGVIFSLSIPEPAFLSLAPALVLTVLTVRRGLRPALGDQADNR